MGFFVLVGGWTLLLILGVLLVVRLVSGVSNAVDAAARSSAAARATHAAGQLLRASLRSMGQRTRRPRITGLFLDGLGLAIFAPALLIALMRIDAWAFEVPSTYSPSDRPAIEVHDPDAVGVDQTLFFTPQLAELTDREARCCDDLEDDVRKLDVDAARGPGYKVIVNHAFWKARPAPENRAPDLVCPDNWAAYGANDDGLTRWMAAIQNLKAPFPVDVWAVDTASDGIHEGEPYMAPTFRETCEEVNCLSKFLLLGQPSRYDYALAYELSNHEAWDTRLGQQDPLARDWERPNLSPLGFYRATHGGRTRAAANIVGPDGHIRATIKGTWDNAYESNATPLDVLAALRKVVEKDGHDFPDEILTAHRVIERGSHEANLARYWGELYPPTEARLQGRPPGYRDWVQAQREAGALPFWATAAASGALAANAWVPREFRYGLVSDRDLNEQGG